MLQLDGVHFRWYFQDLGHPSTDLHETLWMYRVYPKIMQRHNFDFRSGRENRKLEFPRKPDYNPMQNFSPDSGFFRY